MGLIGKISKRGLLDKNFPPESPVIELSKEQQEELNNGKVIMVTDSHYQAKYMLFKRSLVIELSKENLEVQCMENMDLNEVRQDELREFYRKNPQYSPL